MKTISVYTIITVVLLLVGAGIWQGCKPKGEDNPANPTLTTRDSTFFTTVYIGCDEPGGKKGLALLYFRQDLLKGKYQPIQILGADYMRFNYTNFTEIFAALQIGHSALIRRDPVIEKYQSASAFWEDMFKVKSGFVKRQSLSKEQASDLVSKKSILLSNVISPYQSDGFDYLAILMGIFATPVYAQNSGYATPVNSMGSITWGEGAEIAVGIAIGVAAISVGGTAVVIGGVVLGGAVFFDGVKSILDRNVKESAENAGRALNRGLYGGSPENSGASSRTAGGTANDPIVSGLDGGRVFLHPAGEFLAIRSKNDEFAAQVRFEPVGLRPVSTTTSLAVRTGKDVVSITVKPLVIHVNGQEIKSDFSTYLLQDKAYLTRPAANRYEIITTWGDLIEVRVLPTFNLSWYVRTLNEKRKNQVEGLLGQFNDNPEDDFQDKAGNIYKFNSPRTDFYKKYANDWRITQNQSILVYPAGKTSDSYTKLEFPEKGISLFDFDVADRQKAEQTCRNAGITGEPDLSNCMIDVLATGMNEMAEQMGLAFKLKQESATYFQRLSPYSGKSSQGAVAVTVGDKIYAGLGINQLDWAMYNPATDQWTMKTPFSAGKTSFVRMGTFVIGKKVYCVGGWIDQTATNALWEYDTDTDKWTKRKDLPGAARYNIAAFSAGGKGYALFGTIGWGGPADYPTKSAMYEYDPITDNWTTKADFPANPRGNNINNTEFNGMVMLINGRPFVGNGSGGTIFSDWYEYIPTRDVWEKRANSFGGTYYFSVGNIGYVLSHNVRSYAMTYDATTDTWSKYPGKEIYIPLQTNVLRGVYQAPTLHGKSYLGLGNGIKDWWSFTP